MRQGSDRNVVYTRFRERTHILQGNSATGLNLKVMANQDNGFARYFWREIVEHNP